MRRPWLALLPAFLLSTACGPSSDPPPPYELTADQVAAWAPNVSALGAYLWIYDPVAVYDGQSVLSDPSCPSVTRDATTLTIAGGCSETGGKAWSGSVVMDLTDQHHQLTFTDFGSGNGTVTTQNGQAWIADIYPTSRDFTLDLSDSEGSVVKYVGHVDGAYGARTLWQGTGSFTRHQGQTNGDVEATTVDEVFDNDVCDSQPASGTTELTSRGHTAVVTYDGSVDCGNGGTAELTIDGEPKGTITGVSCSMATESRSERASGAWLAGTLAFAGAWLARKKKRECS